jgi:hypothetical protein
MNAIKVRKQYELHGADEQHLERRIATFREALRARSGDILGIKRKGGVDAAPRASIVYQIPLAAKDVEMPAA